MSIFSEIKSSASELKTAWSKLPSLQKSLDVYNLINVGFFVFAFLVMVVAGYTRSVTNATLVLFPLFLAAIGASIDAIGGARKDEIGIARVHEDGKCFDLAQRVTLRSIWRKRSSASRYPRTSLPMPAARSRAS